MSRTGTYEPHYTLSLEPAQLAKLWYNMRKRPVRDGAMNQDRMNLTQRDHELRRREWLTIYLPLAIGLLLFLALLVAITVLGFREENLGNGPASAWGDTSAIIVLLEVAAISLLPLAALVGLCALVIWLIVRLQPLLRQGQEITGVMRQRVSDACDRLVSVTRYRLSVSMPNRSARILIWRVDSSPETYSAGPALSAMIAVTCSSRVLLPIPGSPPIRIRLPGTMPPPSTRENSAIGMGIRSQGSPSICERGRGTERDPALNGDDEAAGS